MADWISPITNIQTTDASLFMQFSVGTNLPGNLDDLLLGVSATLDGQPLQLFSPSATQGGIRITYSLSTDIRDINVRAQDAIEIAYDAGVGVISFDDASSLNSFNSVHVVNASAADTPTINDSGLVDPAFVPPWQQMASPAKLNKNRVVIIANNNSSYANSVTPGYEADPWPLAMAKYYCDERGIPRANIVEFDMGPNAEIWTTNFPTEDWWRDTFSTDIAAKMDAINAQAVLCAPGVPWVTVSPAFAGDTTQRRGSVAQMAAMARHVLADPVGRSCVGKQEISGNYDWLWWNGVAPETVIINEATQRDVGYKINGVSDISLGRQLLFGKNIWMDFGRTQEKTTTEKLGNPANMMVPGGRIGITSRISNFSGDGVTVHPDGVTTETEALAKNIIDKATTAETNKFNNSRAEAILFHIYDSFAPDLGEMPLAITQAALKAWGFTSKYYYRSVNAVDARLESYAPKVDADYFCNPADITAGVFPDTSYTTPVVDQEVATQLGGVRNEDMYNTQWFDTWSAPASGYCGAVLTMGPSTAFNYGTAHERKGAFAWMTQVMHKTGGTDTRAHLGQLFNLLRGMSLCEASYYLSGSEFTNEMICGDPMYMPFPTGNVSIPGDELNDVKYAALKATAGVPVTDNDHMADMYYRWLIINGGTGAPDATIQDLEYTMLASQGATIPSTLNDMWWEVLVAGGYGTVDVDQQLNDMFLKFWLAGGTFGPAYVFDASHYNGTDQFIRRNTAFDGVTVDGTQIIVSVFFRADGGSGGGGNYILHHGFRTRIWWSNLNRFGVDVFNNAGGNVGTLETGAIDFVDGTFHHILVSIDSGNATGSMWLDNAQLNILAPIISVDTIKMTNVNCNVGSASNGIDFWNGCFGELYMAYDQFLDFNVAANRQKFINTDLTPVDLGADGSGPTGVAPTIYLKNGGRDGLNQGAGGDFDQLDGPPTVCNITPFPVILDMEELAHFMTNEGWTIINQTPDAFTIDFGPDYMVPRAFMESCNFAGYPAPIGNDLKDGVQLQGFCI